MSVWCYDFIPKGSGTPERGEAVDERDKYPEDVQHKATEWFAADAWDERFSAVVPVCSVGNYQAYLAAACCMCEVVPGALS